MMMARLTALSSASYIGTTLSVGTRGGPCGFGFENRLPIFFVAFFSSLFHFDYLR